jgi:hypothetical protein
MRRAAAIILTLALTFGVPPRTVSADPVDPWTAWVAAYADDHGIGTDQALDEIDAFLSCLDGHCRPESQRWERTALVAGWSQAEWDGCLRNIVQRESHGQPDVIYRGTRRRPEFSIGLTQLNWRGAATFFRRYVTTPADLLEPLTNLYVAHEFYVATGSTWGPWGGCPRR